MACRGVHDRVLRRGLCVPVAVCVVLRLRCLKVESRLMDCHQGLTVASPLDQCAAERASVLVGICAVSTSSREGNRRSSTDGCSTSCRS